MEDYLSFCALSNQVQIAKGNRSLATNEGAADDSFLESDLSEYVVEGGGLRVGNGVGPEEVTDSSLLGIPLPFEPISLIEEIPYFDGVIVQQDGEAFQRDCIVAMEHAEDLSDLGHRVNEVDEALLDLEVLALELSLPVDPGNPNSLSIGQYCIDQLIIMKVCYITI